jgi:hypothetical protein
LAAQQNVEDFQEVNPADRENGIVQELLARTTEKEADAEAEAEAEAETETEAEAEAEAEAETDRASRALSQQSRESGVSSGKEEKETLLTTLKETLADLTYDKIAERDASRAENMVKQLSYVPIPPKYALFIA